MSKKNTSLLLLCGVLSFLFIGCNTKSDEVQPVDHNENAVIANESLDKNNTLTENTMYDAEQAFTTVDLKGNQIDDSIFDGYDLTIINYWAVYCPYCIEELPDLNDWAKELSDQNIQVLGIVSNQNHNDEDERIIMTTDETIEEASKIIEENNVDYTNIVTNDYIRDFFNIDTISFPTTFFVDNNGHIIDNSVITYSGTDLFKERLNTYLTDGKLEPMPVDENENSDEQNTYYEIGEKITLDNGEKIVVVVDNDGYLFGILDSESTWYYAYVGTDMTDEEQKEFDEKVAEITRPLPRR